MNLKDNEVLLTHDNSGFCGIEKLRCFFKNDDDFDEVKDYIAQLTKYAGIPSYLNSITNLQSAFYFKNTLIQLLSKKQKNEESYDKRGFLESKVTINGSLDAYKQEMPFSEILDDEVFENKLKKAILFSLADPETTLYCIYSDDSIRDYMFSEYSNFSKMCSVLSRCEDSNISIVETVGEIPKINASIILFKYISQEDIQPFKDGVDLSENAIVVNLLSKKPSISFKIENPTFAQTIIAEWLKKKSAETTYNKILNHIEKNTQVPCGISQEILMNCLCKAILCGYYNDIHCVISKKEEKEMKEYSSFWK